jgi:hypothetical protein
MSMRSTADVMHFNFGFAPNHPEQGEQVWFSEAAGAWDGFALTVENQVQTPLNLWLPLRSPAQAPALIAFLKANTDGFHSGVLGLRYVHFARFVMAPGGEALMVMTSFDGDMQSYLMDFIATMAELFNGVMQYIANPPRLPVEKYPNDFWQFVAKQNLPGGVIAAYPQLPVLEVLRNAGNRGNRLVHPPSLPQPAAVPAAPTTGAAS